MRLGTALALGLPLLALPLLLLLPFDSDRALPLAFLPGVWLGWKIARPAHRIDAWLFIWAVGAMLLSAVLSPHSARAFVMLAAVGWTLAGGLVARNLAASVSATRLVLGGLTAGAVLGTLMLRFGVDAHSSTFPIYGNSRLFGAHQFAGCCSALALLIHSRPGSPPVVRGLSALAALIVLGGLFWSGSRAPVAALALMLGLWVWRGTSTERRALACWAPALVATALVISLYQDHPYPGMGWSAAVKRTAEATSVEQVSSERSRFWSETWAYARTSPWVGYGADGYRFVQPAQNGSQPHNVLLQWFIEYGVLGLIPLTLLLIRGISVLIIPRSPSNSSAPPLHVWAGAALAGTAAYGLLDGVFYHATIFMPAAIIAGLALGMRPPPAQTTPHHFALHRLLRPLLLAGLVAMLLHGWLGLMLMRAPYVTPESMPARLLRMLPSTTAGLQNWIERWRPQQPEVAMEWIKWAQTVSVESASFHVHAAQIYIWEKDYKAAEIELLHCLAKVHHLERPDVETALATVRALAAGKPLPPPSP